VVQRDTTVELIIIDQGIGISEEDQKHLFERFFRGGNATVIQGTGLGLHLVDRYMRLLGGSVQIKSELNKGTELHIQFPMR
jgi:signal transduction histidine kinase